MASTARARWLGAAPAYAGELTNLHMVDAASAKVFKHLAGVEREAQSGREVA